MKFITGQVPKKLKRITYRDITFTGSIVYLITIILCFPLFQASNKLVNSTYMDSE